MLLWMVVGLCIEWFIVVWFLLKVKFLIIKWLVLVFILIVVVIIIMYIGIWSYVLKVVNGKCNLDVYNYMVLRERIKFGIMF